MQSRFEHWLEYQLRQVPALIDYMLSQIEPSTSTKFNNRVSGSKDVMKLPFRVDPMTDADDLYANLVILGQELLENVGGISPLALKKHWATMEPQGIPARVSREIVAALTSEVTEWMITVAYELEKPKYSDSIKHIAKLIRTAQRKYPLTPFVDRFSPRECPLCQTLKVQVFWAQRVDRLPVVKCKFCGWQLEKEKAVESWLDVIRELAHGG